MKWLRERLRGDSERGAVTVWIVMIVGSGLVLFSGLMLDAGGLVNARSEATDAAYSLARAAASQVVQVDGAVEIDDGRAFDEVERLALEQWPDLTWDLAIGDGEVTVTVTGRYEAQILSAVGWTGTEVEATRTAESVR